MLDQLPPLKRAPHRRPKKKLNLGWLEQFDDRERREILFAIDYAVWYSHGTAGHLAYTVIAKLALYINDLALTGARPEGADLITPEPALK